MTGWDCAALGGFGTGTVRRRGSLHQGRARCRVELLLTEAALDKLGARTISADEVGQLLRNAHVVVRNPCAASPGSRRLLIGRTNGGRRLTLVIEQTVEPATWLTITGWACTEIGRKLLPDRW
jgi:hypothetical protein